MHRIFHLSSSPGTSRVTHGSVTIRINGYDWQYGIDQSSNHSSRNSKIVPTAPQMKRNISNGTQSPRSSANAGGDTGRSQRRGVGGGRHDAPVGGSPRGQGGTDGYLPASVGLVAACEMAWVGE